MFELAVTKLVTNSLLLFTESYYKPAPFWNSVNIVSRITEKTVGVYTANTWTVLYNIVTLSAELVTCLLSPLLFTGTHWALPIDVHIYSNCQYTQLINRVMSLSLVSETSSCFASAWWLEIQIQFCLWKQKELRKTKVFYAIFDCNQLDHSWTWTHVPTQASVNGLQHIRKSYCLHCRWRQTMCWDRYNL
jgi:hypothetical protein